MKRMKKQLVTFLILIIGLAAVFMVILTTGKRKEEKEESIADRGTNEMEDEESLPEDEQSQILMEKYGIPEKYFIEIDMEDPVIEAIDFDYINQLKTYTAVPSYEADQYMGEMANFLCQDKESFEVSTKGAQDYEKSSEGEMKGWGALYSYKDSSGDEFLTGSRYMIMYDPGIQMKKIKAADQREFVDHYIEQFHLGIWDGKDNWMKVEEAGSSFNGAGSFLNGTVYVDGIKLENDLFGNTARVDDDGARYLGASDLSFEFDQKHQLCSIHNMYSAELSAKKNLKRSYGDMDDILDIIRDRKSKWTISTGAVYHFQKAHFAYNLGICENGTYLLTPWLILTGSEDLYYPSEKMWRTHGCLVRINLSAGTKFGS